MVIKSGKHFNLVDFFPFPTLSKKFVLNKRVWLFKILSYTLLSYVYKIPFVIGTINWKDMLFQRLRILYARFNVKEQCPQQTRFNQSQ